jgi:predicted nucleic acid-binding protein
MTPSFDEVITPTRRRTGSNGAAKRSSDRLRGHEGYPRVYELLQVSTAVFTDALAVFERYDDQTLSFTDATTAALVDRHAIDGVLSFDDFNGAVQRFDPGEA